MARRYRCKTFAVVVMLALVAQLMLSFGHVHASQEHRPLAVSGHSLCPLATTAPNCPTPAEHGDGDACPVCQAISTVATAIVPSAIEVVMASETRQTCVPQCSIRVCICTDVKNFQARGPPQTHAV